MIKLGYFLYEGAFWARDVSENATNASALEIYFDEPFYGRLVLGERSVSICEGKCTVRLGEICDGVHTPFVIKDKKRIETEGFEKRGNVIKLLPSSESTIRGLIEKQLGCQKRIDALEVQTRAILDKIEHTTIF